MHLIWTFNGHTVETDERTKTLAIKKAKQLLKRLMTEQKGDPHDPPS